MNKVRTLNKILKEKGQKGQQTPKEKVKRLEGATNIKISSNSANDTKKKSSKGGKET